MIHAAWIQRDGQWLFSIPRDQEPRTGDVVLVDLKGDTSGRLRLLGEEAPTRPAELYRRFRPGKTVEAEDLYESWALHMDDIARAAEGATQDGKRSVRASRARRPRARGPTVDERRDFQDDFRGDRVPDLDDEVPF